MSSEHRNETVTFSDIQDIEAEAFDAEYTLTNKKFGKGRTAIVVLAHKPAIEPQQSVACKIVIVRKRHWDDDTLQERDKLQNEIAILTQLNHPNIIYLERVFRSERTLYLFQELFNGGDLATYLKQIYRGSEPVVLNDPQCCFFSLQILSALDFMHDKGIVHRDLKPANILLDSRSPKTRIVLCDFGSAKQPIREDGTEDNEPGAGWITWEYLAPELTNSEGSLVAAQNAFAADMWSTGAVVTALFAGNSMFALNIGSNLDSADFRTVVKSRTIDCDLSTMIRDENQAQVWREMSQLAINLVRDLLVTDPRQRKTAKEAIQAPWFTEVYKSEEMQAVRHHSSQARPERSISSGFVTDLERLIQDEGLMEEYQEAIGNETDSNFDEDE